MPDTTRRWTEDHGEPGLRRKFDVYKPRDNMWSETHDVAAYPASARIGADGEFVFVLRPETDVAAMHALATYAAVVSIRDPTLAYEIDGELARIRRDNGRAAWGRS